MRRFFLVLLVLASGCATHARYSRPAVETTPAFKEDENWKVASPADAGLKGNWWEVFGDPALNALEDRIAISNQTLLAAAAQLQSARASLRGARANFGPEVSLSPTIARARQSGTRALSSFHDAYGDFLLPVDVSYEADVWGRIRQTVNVSRANEQAVEADLQSASLSLHAELAVDYFTLRGLDRERQLIDDTVTAYARELELTTIVVPSSSRAGSWKQRLLPEPVGMITIVSRPSIAARTARSWPGRNLRTPKCSRTFRLRSVQSTRAACVIVALRSGMECQGWGTSRAPDELRGRGGRGANREPRSAPRRARLVRFEEVG